MRRKSVRKFPGEKKNDDVAVKLINASEFDTEMENVGKKNKKLPVKKLKKTVQVQPNEDDELDDDEEASDKNYEPEQHDMRMVISGGQLKKNKAIIKKMDAPVSNENESVAARIMKVRCRPHSLELLIKDLTPKQIDAVKDVGFGGILGLKLTETCKIMMPWLVERFNGASLMFNIGVNKEFVVTRYDVYDVFCLPMNVGNDVPEIAIVRVGENIDSQLKDVWKQQFNVHGYDGIPLGKIEARIRELIDGGDEFKKLFVMHALCSFLTHRQ
ncbi:uncharacterized protein LOC130591408 [Beta vulgaris subsp. vulgaris]|uniref:uncharacterized protein LOC130591408 n=1 Tax=Beta vulgaris subsp. vulgaris TaxID=3555 RepID=UPI0025466996|nr:uncharacterized protein LOC130591408 [Beta vulgaris subsp. vulgaris]